MNIVSDEPNQMTINILGTDYKVKLLSVEEYPKLKIIEASGLAEVYNKELIIDKDLSTSIKSENEDTRYENVNEYTKRVIRHEVIHAYFHEASLSDYCKNETLVECLAQMLPRLSISSNYINDNFNNFMSVDKHLN